MNPFLEIPVCLGGGGNQNLPEKIVTGRVIPGEIAFHYPGYHTTDNIFSQEGK